MTRLHSAVLAIALVLAGCGPSGPPTYLVEGNVTLDGQPLDSGDIVLEAIAPIVPSATGEIRQGVYRLKAQAARYRVKITSVQPVPGSEGKGMMGGPLLKYVVPTRYNTQTKLEAEVTPAEPNQYDFTLKGDKP